MGSNTEKKTWANLQNSYKNWSKEIKSNNWMESNKEKSNIAIAILNRLPFLKDNKNSFAFWW